MALIISDELVAHRHAYFGFLCGFLFHVRDEKRPARIWEDPRVAHTSRRSLSGCMRPLEVVT